MVLEFFATSKDVPARRIPWDEKRSPGGESYEVAGWIGPRLCWTNGGRSALSLMPPGSSVLAIEYKQNFFAPAVGDTLIARAEVVRSGKSVSVVTAKAFSIAKGVEKPVGLLVATMMTMPDAA